MLTPEQIAEGWRLHAAATPGPWFCPELFTDTITVSGMTNVGISAYSTIVSVHPLNQNDGDGREWYAYGDMDANRQLISYLRNHATALLAAADAERRLREALRHSMESHESLAVLLGNGSRITTQGYVAAVCQCEKYAAEARAALAGKEQADAS